MFKIVAQWGEEKGHSRDKERTQTGEAETPSGEEKAHSLNTERDRRGKKEMSVYVYLDTLNTFRCSILFLLRLPFCMLYCPTQIDFKFFNNFL